MNNFVFSFSTKVKILHALAILSIFRVAKLLYNLNVRLSTVPSLWNTIDDKTSIAVVLFYQVLAILYFSHFPPYLWCFWSGFQDFFVDNDIVTKSMFYLFQACGIIFTMSISLSVIKNTCEKFPDFYLPINKFFLLSNAL